MRTSTSLLTALALVVSVGACSPARYGGSEDRHLAHGLVVDAGFVEPSDDASVVTPHDAWSASQPDAWTDMACPSYGTDVRPVYVLHCATCHTTGREVHFGSSYSVASSSSSGCRTSMAACTISLGRPGGSMARRDTHGGFTTGEIAMLQQWIACGFPM
jgi:hypothetical protein